jgi:hypothetical protein
VPKSCSAAKQRCRVYGSFNVHSTGQTEFLIYEQTHGLVGALVDRTMAKYPPNSASAGLAKSVTRMGEQFCAWVIALNQDTGEQSPASNQVCYTLNESSQGDLH